MIFLLGKLLFVLLLIWGKYFLANGFPRETAIGFAGELAENFSWHFYCVNNIYADLSGETRIPFFNADERVV